MAINFKIDYLGEPQAKRLLELLNETCSEVLKPSSFPIEVSVVENKAVVRYGKLKQVDTTQLLQIMEEKSGMT